MRKLFHSVTKRIYIHFKFFWVVLTIILLSILIAMTCRTSLIQSQRDLKDAAQTISDNVDGFLETLFQEIYTLPVFGQELVNCNTGLYQHLQRITINQPIISGLVLSNKAHTLICSTLPSEKTFTSSSILPRSISGPYQLSLYDQPIYLIQQRFGNYQVDIVIISSVLENILRSSKEITNSIALYNILENKNILRIGRINTRNDWVANNKQDVSYSLKSQSIFAMEKIQSIDGLAVLAFEDDHQALKNFWFSQSLLSLFFLLSSWLLYSIVKKLVTKHYSLLTAMKLALKNNEFFPVYQPIFDREKGIYSGAEVLLRWQENLGNIILPDFFIEEAETTGLIVPITLEIIKIAFKDSQTIFKEHPNFHLAFNISALHFKDKHFFPQFNVLMNQYDILPAQIMLEITERDLLDINDSTFSNRMKKLRQEGFSLAVDDYGTGHASISYLQHFPFNYLKIDQIFIRAIGTKAITESLNDAIIQMAKGLHLMIIAEGVETQEQVDYLSANGVQFLQGWYYTKALSMEQLMRFLK